MHDGRGRTGGQHAGQAGILDEGTTLHEVSCFAAFVGMDHPPGAALGARRINHRRAGVNLTSPGGAQDGSAKKQKRRRGAASSENGEARAAQAPASFMRSIRIDPTVLLPSV